MIFKFVFRFLVLVLDMKEKSSFHNVVVDAVVHDDTSVVSHSSDIRNSNSLQNKVKTMNQVLVCCNEYINKN